MDRETGRTRLKRAVGAVDSGQAVNPDGIRNQIEGGILQASSWTLYEAVGFDETRITSADWASYPMLRFPDIPDSVEVQVIDRPGQPFLGTGEAAQGPTAAAIGNAMADATGARLRELLLADMRHRLKNFMTVLHALVTSSLPKDDKGAAEFADKFLARVRALASAGDLVMQQGASIHGDVGATIDRRGVSVEYGTVTVTSRKVPGSHRAWTTSTLLVHV